MDEETELSGKMTSEGKRTEDKTTSRKDNCFMKASFLTVLVRSDLVVVCSRPMNSRLTAEAMSCTVLFYVGD